MDSSIFLLLMKYNYFYNFNKFFMIITSFCKNFLEKYSEEYLKKSKNPLKIDKRIIFWLLDWSKNISFKTAENLTKKFNKFLKTEENLEKFFIKEKLLSEEKERKIIIDFPDNKEKKEENSFWLEIIHYILMGKFEGFGKVWFLIFLFIFSLIILIFLHYFL